MHGWACSIESVENGIGVAIFTSFFPFPPALRPVWFLGTSRSSLSNKISRTTIKITCTFLCSPFTFCPVPPTPLQMLRWTAVARQRLIEQGGYAIDQLEIFQMKSGVKSFHSYSSGFMQGMVTRSLQHRHTNTCSENICVCWWLYSYLMLLL